jgi:N-acetylglucosaminyldiphosphoundecaprenol N-acetyl-beta-D-mannosaminyltransferase
MKPARIEILGVPVDCITMDQAVQAVDDMLAGAKPCSVMAVNPEKVIRATADPLLLDRLRRADLLIPDGIGVVLAARLLRVGSFERVPGSELMPRLCARAADAGRAIFLFGGSPDVNRQTATVLRRRFPGIRIVGASHGYLQEKEMPDLIAAINASRADLLFVALGSPMQEGWIDRYLPMLNVKVCQGVGGTFDVIAGRCRRAPVAVRRLHLEWLYRLVTQPTRIGRQAALPLFAWRVLKRKMTG